MAILQRPCANDCIRLRRKARTFDYQASDVGYVPLAMGHYVENAGSDTVRFLEMFLSSYFADVSLTQWMALTPPELVQTHLSLDQQTMAALTKAKPVIVSSQPKEYNRVGAIQWRKT